MRSATKQRVTDGWDTCAGVGLTGMHPAEGSNMAVMPKWKGTCRPLNRSASSHSTRSRTRFRMNGMTDRRNTIPPSHRCLLNANARSPEKTRGETVSAQVCEHERNDCTCP